VKTNIAECLERELSSPDWQHEPVNMGGVTDNYQEAEARYRIMPDILRLLIKYKTPAVISTKSELILRDYDLFAELARVAGVNIAVTVTTSDIRLQELIEPGGSPPLSRFAVLSEFSRTNASVGLHMMPIIPYITDRTENIESVFAGGAQAGAGYFLPYTLRLREPTKTFFLSFIEKHFPHLCGKYKALYKSDKAGKQYSISLYKKMAGLRSKYGISADYTYPAAQA
jgi:DNA repair photolyase